jgi:lysophospholipase L1-like esterase
VYGGTNYWRCAAAPTSNANSGTLTQASAFTTPFPVYLAYDLSAVQSSQRGQVLLHWDQSVVTGDYDCTLTSRPANNIPTSYTIDVNSGAGGTLPGSSWVTKATVTSSEPYHSRQHLVDMTGCNWIRINVTAVTGSASNNNVALNMDIHDAHAGAGDSWLCCGDSITQRAFMWDDGNGLSSVLSQQIANAFPAYYPVWEDAGVVGYTATDVQAVFSTWLALFPGKYVMLNLGTNDANLAGSYLTNFSAKMTNMVSQVLAASKIPVIPTIPWGGTTNLLANVPTLNTQIASIIAANPGTIAGPDLYAFFAANQSLIDPTDHIHPTDPALATGQGYNQYRTQWVNWATKNIYASGDPNTFAFDRYHFVVQG